MVSSIAGINDPDVTTTPPLEDVGEAHLK